MKRVEDIADYVVVGTGAGGATAARVLSGAGWEVLMLEEGPRLHTPDRPRDLLHAMRSLRDFGTATTRGVVPIPVLQGRCVGGATAVNSGIIWRIPEDVRLDWIERYGLGELVEEKALDAAFTVIERELEVSETSAEVMGGNARLMAKASELLGLPGKPITRNAARCKGSAQCLQGCPGEARQSMDVSYVPMSLKNGARLRTLVRVDKVIFEGTRAVGVEGVTLDPGTHQAVTAFTARARRAVILAASTVQSPVILRRSGLRGMVGERFMAHPGVAVVGRFRDPVEMSFGGTQAYEVPLRDRKLKLESLSLPPEMLAARIPGAGPEWNERITQLDHFAQWATLVRMEAVGRVRPALFGHGSDAAVRYMPTARDIERLRDGVALLCRMMFAVGATEVYPGVGGLPSVMTDPAEVRLIEQSPVNATQFSMVASHLFASVPAGRDPSNSAVDPSLAVHGTEGLYVMDSSALPTNLGVNPQHTITALAWMAASRLANDSRHAQA